MDTSCFDPYPFDLLSVEDGGASGAKGVAPDAGQAQPDPDWQPL
ncbi:MAG: hypothetical protein OJI74_15940 [Rhodanobacter thiooxydans]|nr:hypothetical protein [Rhodanobacter thiooxydans]